MEGIKEGQEASHTLDYASAPAAMNNLVEGIRHYNATELQSNNTIVQNVPTEYDFNVMESQSTLLAR